MRNLNFFFYFLLKFNLLLLVAYPMVKDMLKVSKKSNIMCCSLQEKLWVSYIWFKHNNHIINMVGVFNSGHNLYDITFQFLNAKWHFKPHPPLFHVLGKDKFPYFPKPWINAPINAKIESILTSFLPFGNFSSHYRFTLSYGFLFLPLHS